MTTESDNPELPLEQKPDEVELQGLDVNLHAETAYEFGPISGGGFGSSVSASRTEKVDA